MSEAGDDRPGRGRQPKWSDLHGPLRLLVFLLIAAAAIGLYKELDYLVARVVSVLLLFLFAAIIALLLDPLVDRLESAGWLPGRRGAAVLAVNLMVLVGFLGLMAILIPSIAQQSTALGVQAPSLLHDAQGVMSALDANLNAHGIPVHFAVPTQLDTLIAPVLGSALQILTQTIGVLVNLLLIIVIAIYLQLEGRQMIAALRHVAGEGRQFFDFTLTAATGTLAAYVRGQVIFAAVLAAYTGIALSIIGVRFALVIALVTFFLELVPLIGAPVSMGLAVVIAVLQGPIIVVLTAIATVVGHVVLAYTVGLRVVGKATRIHPLVAMAALLIGAQLGGVLGALFAIPLAGIFNVYLGALYRSRQGEAPFALSGSGAEAVESLPRLGEQMTQAVNEAVEAAEAAESAPPVRRRTRRAVPKSPPTRRGPRTPA